jgi:hypothetical protein
MMKLIVVVVLTLIAVVTRHRDESLMRHYLGFVLVGLGAFIWAGIFDALSSGRSVVNDGAFYKQVLLWSVLGFLLALVGFIASFWCRQKILKVSAMLIGIAAGIMCAIIIILPY